MSQVSSEENDSHAAFAEWALYYVSAGEAGFESLLKVIHGQTIVVR